LLGDSKVLKFTTADQRLANLGF
ncbi:ATP-binding protein, partial [Bacillus thuringiensis]|nr:ATP-binding protein [Bacillus thuringiensis]